ncbi:bilirubin oxidase [Diaporthe helianthi]|uniref:Bilirubin oxidase n=1 Tax=Diaporthe helianthi TaxID=158607 RepID=A0A2P5HXL6_DIAHE|nr:bilirubin oxidase [Diaporthe helianthi]
MELRKYRFRFLNAAVSRSFALYFALTLNVNGKLRFKVIASDASLLVNPVQVSDLYISMAEPYEIVFDFSAYVGQAVELRNLPKAGGIGTDDDCLNTGKVMRFMVSSTPVEDPSSVPDALRSVPFPSSNTLNVIDHLFRFHRRTTEIWELENSSDGWSHPIHVHLVDFRVLARTHGNRAVMPYEAAGDKDVVWLGKEETAIVEAHYAPWDGVYMFHCHNLIDEDHDMMAAFNVTALANWCYNDTTQFLDPMEAKFRAKPFGAGDFQARAGLFSDEAIEEAVKELAEDDPYSRKMMYFK